MYIRLYIKRAVSNLGQLLFYPTTSICRSLRGIPWCRINRWNHGYFKTILNFIRRYPKTSLLNLVHLSKCWSAFHCRYTVVQKLNGISSGNRLSIVFGGTFEYLFVQAKGTKKLYLLLVEWASSPCMFFLYTTRKHSFNDSNELLKLLDDEKLFWNLYGQLPENRAYLTWCT